jgi:hypothetical protein
MEEMAKELDHLRAEAKSRAAECRAKSALVDGLWLFEDINYLIKMHII